MKITSHQLRKIIREVGVSSPNSGGDCYEAAGKYMMEKCLIGDCNLTLVHGEVSGQGNLAGIRYGHAWVEDDGTVIDKSNGRNLKMPKVLYYSIGQIASADMSKWGQPGFGHDVFTGGNFHKYSWEDARKKILDYGHWGPWDLETESGL
tara:strand:- start:199 stop:645 length:447 start_codon:yes stop_codon:yes gene_type:complete